MESKNKTKELIATENRLMVARGEGWGGGVVGWGQNAWRGDIQHSMYI